MKIGITGVAGFIGSHLADVLLEKGHHVIGVYLSMGYLRNIQQLLGLEEPEWYFSAARPSRHSVSSIVRSRACSHYPKGLDDQREGEKAREQCVELFEAQEDAPEAFESPEAARFRCAFCKGPGRSPTRGAG
jgi:nucleoside-diphosphate-sugar epimerase